MRWLAAVLLIVLSAAAQPSLAQSAGARFLEKNAAAPGVVTLPSGLQYKVLKAADGPKPTAASKVTVHYTGRLINGKVFDSSRGGPPATFPLGAVIPGWTEGVQLMSPGARYRFFIPSKLGYGAAGSPPVIPRNAALIFDVELISFD